MRFDSLQFLFFYIVVTLAYFSLRHRGQIYLLLLASVYFYMVFKPVFILILLITIVVDYYAGICIAQAEGRKRKWLLIISLISNIGFLAFFKYWNFINFNLGLILSQFGVDNPLPNTSFELPIGLSFHTFQAMSYTIEVYRRKQNPEPDFITYSLYVMFYPQLVAGPIERPQNILPQFHSPKVFDLEKLKSGLLQMGWGMFKKIVIANRLAIYVDYAYAHTDTMGSWGLLLAAIFYSFQIYCDFSGYSDIAIGAARTMGFDLMTNFKAPYLASSIGDFWRRWHISLSTWFRDYLYIPLGGSKVSEGRLYLNYFVVFLVSGLWHGAAYNFLIWGGLHGLYQVFSMMRSKYFGFLKINMPIVSQLITFLMVTVAWIFFRAKSLSHAKGILTHILNFDFQMNAFPLSIPEILFSFFLILILFIKDKYYEHLSTDHFWLKGAFAILLIYFFGIFSSNQFIYFQF